MDAPQLAVFLVGTAFAAALLSLCLPRGRYGTPDSLLLNLVTPTTAWHNMGYWSPGDDFPTACANLARKLGQLAGLEEGTRVADCGYGSGDSCFLWKDEFRVDTVLGWTNEEGQFLQARESTLLSVTLAHLRAVERRLSSRSSKARLDLRLGDAVEGLKRSLPSSLDAVLALDAAYHFDRAAFFAAAFDALKPGSVLALTDLCLPPTSLSRTDSIILGLICRMTSVPRLMNPLDYVVALEDAGFQDVLLEDITSHVFPGLLSFLERQNSELGGVLGFRWSVLQTSVGASLRWWLGGAGRLAFVIVRARKPLA